MEVCLPPVVVRLSGIEECLEPLLIRQTDHQEDTLRFFKKSSIMFYILTEKG
jgi:hypothetical protein